MNSNQSVDIAIVGGGIVGSVLALGLSKALKDQNVSITLIEKNHPVAISKPSDADLQVFDPRVVALNNNSINFLQTLDIWSAIEKHRVSPYNKMYVWDGEGTGHIEFDARDIHSPSLGAIVENSVLTNSLYDALGLGIGLDSGLNVNGGLNMGGGLDMNSGFDAYLPDNINLLNDTVIGCEAIGADEHCDKGNHSRAAQTKLVLGSGKILQARLVLAADGAQSPLREMNGLAIRQWDYQQTAIITTVLTEHAHNATAWQRFTRFGPLAFLPLSTCSGSKNSENKNSGNKIEQGQQRYCSIVWSLDKDKADQVIGLSDEQFCLELGRAFEFRLGKILHCSKRFNVNLQQVHAKQYIRPGFALVGDAAHRIHPLAGQGVNLGMSDAQVMIEEIVRACQRSVPLTDLSILKRYQRRRKSENLAAMISMEGFKRLFGSDELSIVSARNTGLRLLNGLPSLKRQLTIIAQGYASRS